MKIRIHSLADDLPLPSRASEGSSGYDLRARLDDDIVLGPGERQLIPTAIRLEVPIGYEAQVRPRSGLALRHGVTALNSPGTIDADYRGEIGVILINHGQEPFTVKRGERIAQLVFARVESITWDVVEGLNGDPLEDSGRGSGGFGSTGTG